MRAACIGALILSCVGPAIDAAHAQSTGPVPSTEPIRLAQQQPALSAREQRRAKINENVLHLMGGQLGSGYIVMAHDISVAVNDGNDLRVIPAVGGAGVQNVSDVVFLKGVDLGITNVLVLNNLKETGELGSNLDQMVAYIAPLFHETMQVLVRSDVNSIEDLRGKRVSFNNKGSATAAFAPLVFKTLKIDVQETNMAIGDAVEKLRSGEIDANVCTCPVPVPAMSGAKAEWGLKLLPIPYIPALEKNYYPASMKSEDYPNLIPKDGRIDTIATANVLISYNWPRGTERYARVAKFTEAFFTKFDNLLKPPRHPLWKTVNLAATVKGWQRFPAAQEMLDAARKGGNTASLRSDFGNFVGQKGSQLKQDAADPAVQEKLFQQFLEWSKKAK
jgi:TRAP-type uncharacterized transport system substrate-binding protein